MPALHLPESPNNGPQQKLEASAGRKPADAFSVFGTEGDAMTFKRASLLALAAASLFAGAANAQVKVGVTVSATGPAASLGIPEKNTFTLLPKEIAGKKIEYIVLDDATDTTTAVKNTRKLISEDKVDVVVGSTVTPNSLAMVDVAAESETPMISMAASARIIEPMDAKRAWIFKTPQNDSHMATAIAEHMTNNNVKTVAFIGFADAYGDSWGQEFAKVAEMRKIKVVANERFARTDNSVTGQVLKMMGANPDAVLIAGSGTPAALPEKALKERLQGQDLPDARRGQPRLPARVRQGLRRHVPAGRPAAGGRATA
jgi:branched-chain amino acid transport system substrate-binding protein